MLALVNNCVWFFFIMCLLSYCLDLDAVLDTYTFDANI